MGLFEMGMLFTPLDSRSFLGTAPPPLVLVVIDEGIYTIGTYSRKLDWELHLIRLRLEKVKSY